MSHKAESGRTITGAFHPSSYHLSRHRLAIGYQSEQCHKIDEERGGVEFPAMLAGGIIRREHVVVVVVALAAGAEGDATVLGRVDTPVVRSVAPEVSDTVDGPGDIEDGNVTKDAGEECYRYALTPVTDWNDGWYHETEKNHRRHIQPGHSNNNRR